MKIKYYLLDNPVTPDTEDRRAQVSGYETVSEKEIFEYMTRKGSAITVAEAKANYEEIVGTIDYFLNAGYGVNTEFVNIRPVIAGVFRNDDDRFEHGRHKIKFKAQMGRRYNHTADDVKVEKVAPLSNAPLPVTFEDVASATVNDVMTPGGVARLTGMRLNFNQSDPLQGIFLIDSAKKVHRAELILSQKGTQVVFQIPAGLASDEYTLEVRLLPKGNKGLKTGVLVERLSV
ncbi:MAG: DUF4469 domain-containing protein [Tannerella sp.]|jgi:hypothetical protein|nr:DUF4469 domain-containing protein [Tannerella sp.]